MAQYKTQSVDKQELRLWPDQTAGQEPLLHLYDYKDRSAFTICQNGQVFRTSSIREDKIVFYHLPPLNPDQIKKIIRTLGEKPFSFSGLKNPPPKDPYIMTENTEPSCSFLYNGIDGNIRDISFNRCQSYHKEIKQIIQNQPELLLEKNYHQLVEFNLPYKLTSDNRDQMHDLAIAQICNLPIVNNEPQFDNIIFSPGQETSGSAKDKYPDLK